MDPDKLRKAALDLGASDGRLLLQMGIYGAVQVAKEALGRLANIEEVRLPSYFATVDDIHERDRHMSGVPSQMGRETAEKLIRAHKHRGELLDGIKAWVADMEVARAEGAQELATALAKIRQLEVGIAAYRKRSAEINKLLSRQDRDLDDADAWEASLIDVDGQPAQNS
jgi:hypothetical protein